MTISRYLRNPDLVSPLLQQKIAQVLDQLGYIPNRAPNILSNATSKAIGILLPSLTNQVFAEILRGIEQVTDAHHYQTMLAHYGYQPEREEQRLTALLSYNIDGLILSERQHTPRTLQMIAVAGIPVVEIMDSVSPCLDMAVGFDNRAAAREMMEQILARGYRHPVYMGARLDERTLMKEQGYQQAMRQAGLEPVSIMTVHASSYSAGGALLREAQARYPQVDAVFCTNDDLAMGAAFECQRQGLRIPQDMGIVGFHGHDAGQMMVPKLATVLTYRERMGQVAAEQLLARLRGETPTQKQFDTGFSLLPGGSI